MAAKAANFQDVFIYAGIFALFFLLLRFLLRIAKTEILKEYPTAKSDEFVKQYGYTHDYLMVFPVYDEEYESFNQFQTKFSLVNVLQRFNKAGLDVKYFYSCQRDEIYLKIRATPDRLRQEAFRIGYRLLLDADRLKAKAALGKRRQGDWVWKPIVIVDEFKLSSLQPYQYIYAPYDNLAYGDGLYKEYAALNNHRHIFRGVDRINLIISIIQAPLSAKPAGAGINISKLMETQTLLAAFPIHDRDEWKTLQKRWLNLFGAPWTQPIDDVRNYFGEKIGFYFLYIQHYVTLLMLPALLGLITFLVQKSVGEPEHRLMVIFAVFMIIWTSFFLAIWNRRQAFAAMKWGTLGIEEVQQDRPQFQGTPLKSPINGREFAFFDSKTKTSRSRFAMSVIATLIICVIALVAGIYIFHFWINQNPDKFVLGGINFGSIIASVLNSVVIVVMNMIYQTVAVRLNDFENHRTDIEYEDKLISKVFLFQMVNSFSGLTYVAFIKSFIGVKCTQLTCTSEISASLSTIFLSAMITRCITEVFLRRYQEEKKYQTETEGLIPNIRVTPLEQQYMQAEYHVTTGPLIDYAGLVIQFGYMILFVAAFPLSTTIACMSGYVQIRIDGWKLCQLFRRPTPMNTEDIGVWQDMLTIISILAVIYNLGLILFTGGYCENITWPYRWILFIIISHVIFTINYFVFSTFGEKSADVEIQLQRSEFFIGKVIRNTEDEKEDIFNESRLSINFVINDFDDDWNAKENKNKPGSSIIKA